MAVSEREVRHVADLARIGVAEDEVPRLVAELGGILSHMEVLRAVNTEGVSCAAGISSGGTPLRADLGPAYPLAAPRESFAPALRDGLFLVPRLATHARAGAAADETPLLDGLDEAPDAGEALGAEPS
jgi:aspartyl-tRNA(Asn)/glutamyl-tRNA(Gln) amidotransferase subunit C